MNKKERPSPASAKTKATKKSASVPPATVPHRHDNAVNDIFAQLRKKQKSVALPSSSLTTSGASGNAAVNGGDGDGLYRETAPTLEMDDDAFFASNGDIDSGGRTASRSKKKKSTSSNVDSSSRRNASRDLKGLSRVVTEDEILKMTSSNPKAGTTPNCPFDCDCCF